MSFRDQVTEEVKEAAERSANNNQEREELDQIDVDLAETPFVKFTPTTMPTFTFPEKDDGNPVILFKNNQRIADLGDAATNDDGRDLRLLSTRYLGLVVDDISAYMDADEGFDETVIARTGEDDSTDYRIFDLADENTVEKFDGDAIAVDGNTYEVAETVDEIGGRAILVVDRTASTAVARTLDICGGPTAGMDPDTGQVNGGLVEYAPDDADVPDNGRYARPFVELRDDLYGAEVGIMVSRRSEIDDDFAEAVADDENRSDMMWYSVFDMESGESLERGNYGEPTAYTFVEWNFDPSVGRLPDEDWEFVVDYVEGGFPTDEESITENIEDNAELLSEDPNVGRMVDAIQNVAASQE